jgi:hypothetical protein
MNMLCKSVKNKIVMRQLITRVLLSIFLISPGNSFADIFTDIKIMTVSPIDGRAVIKLNGSVHVVAKGGDLQVNPERLILKDVTDSKLLFEYFVSDVQQGYVWVNKADSSVSYINFTASPE